MENPKGGNPQQRQSEILITDCSYSLIYTLNYETKILLLSFLFLSLIGYAQPIDWNKKLPADPNVLIGKLPNGITYYLRHNEEPKDRASFFIIRNAGALLENGRSGRLGPLFGTHGL